MRKSKLKEIFGIPSVIFISIPILATIVSLFLIWYLPLPVDTIELQKSPGNTYCQGTMKDGSDQFVVYSDEGATKWYRVIVADDSARYISEYPCLIVKENLVKIRVRWSPNKYADCEDFLKLSGEDPEAFCQKYHLPTNRIKTICGGW